MIDLHMIPSAGFERGFAGQVARVQHPLITVQVGEYVAGNMLEARARSYARGTQKYVSWMDPDDEVLDIGWVDRAIELMERDADVSAVYPRWQASQNGCVVRTVPIHEWNPATFNVGSTPAGHHLTIMRRENVHDFFALLRQRTATFQNRLDMLLVHSQMRYGRCVAEPTLAYNWRLQPKSGRHMVNPSHVTDIGNRFMQETALVMCRRCPQDPIRSGQP